MVRDRYARHTHDYEPSITLASSTRSVLVPGRRPAVVVPRRRRAAVVVAVVAAAARGRAAVIALGAADHALCADLALTVIVGLVVLDTCTLVKLRLMTTGEMWFWVSWI